MRSPFPQGALQRGLKKRTEGVVERTRVPVKKLSGALLGVAAGLLVYHMPPPNGLSAASMHVAGIFLCAIFFWVAGVFPFYVTSLSLVFLFVFTGAVPFGTAFSGYLSTTWWFMLGAIGISAALSKSGLMRRFTYRIMKLFPPTFKGQILGMVTATAVVTPLIPSVTAKSSMLFPVAKSISDLMGYQPKSREIHGMFLACFTSVAIMSHTFINSNFDCYVAMELMPAETRASISWGGWFLAAFPRTVFVMAILVAGILVLYRPRGETAQMTREDIQRELDAMGPLDRRSWLVIGVLAAAVLLWATERLHGIPGYQVALLGFLVLLTTGVLTAPEVKSLISWDTLLMSGALLGIGAVFDAVGINAFVSAAVTPFMQQISGNAYLFAAFVSVLMYLLKLIYSNTMALLAIVGPILIPVAQAAGISPWVAIYMTMVPCYTWNVIYQCNYVVIGFAAFDGERNLHFGSLTKLSYVFMVVNIFSLWLMVPYWKLLGLIG